MSGFKFVYIQEDAHSGDCGYVQHIEVHLTSNHSAVGTLSSQRSSAHDRAVSLSGLVSKRLFNVC